MRKVGRLALIACLASIQLLVSALALPATAAPSQPKLVVLLVVDQFSYDYLNRFQDRLGQGGFRFLTDHGASFANCRYKQATTETAVGHSIISSGAYPWSTGVVANEWYDRARDRFRTAVTDDTYQLVGAPGNGVSCRAMAGTGLGDQLKLASNGRSRVIAISLKDRASLFLAGRMGSAALWWDLKSGNFVSSSLYGPSLPGWATAFNSNRYADRYFGKTWQRLLPEASYSASTRDDFTYEKALPGDGKVFPHVITGGAASPNEAFYTTFAMTPWANQMVADLAKEAIAQEGLGSHSDPDMLALSFSATDYLGHSFGPYSQEVEDMFLRLDQTLANLFGYIDQKVGMANCVIAVTGDHGVMPIPEFLKEKGVDAGRIDPKTFKQLLDQALDSRLGAEDWVTCFEPPNLYLNLNAIDKQKYRQPDVEALAAKQAHLVPGVGEVYTAFQFFGNQVPTGPSAEAVKLSYFWGRSGELYITPKQGYIWSSESGGTSHGGPYSYDSQVPLLLFGTSIRGGRYGEAASPADIAPTLAAILGINAPWLSEGRVLSEACSQVFGPPRPGNFQSVAAQSGGDAR